jgi:hypothetical protein
VPTQLRVITVAAGKAPLTGPEGNATEARPTTSGNRLGPVPAL